MRLLLGIPTAGNPTQPFLASLAALRMPANATAFDRASISGNFVPAQRELLVRRALSQGANVLAMVDDDMVLPPDALASLCADLDAHPEAALVGALYYSRDGLRPMAADGWRSDDTRAGFVPAFGTDARPVDAVGFGCVVLRTAALAALEPPYFHAQVFLEERAGRARVCNEDYLFCERLRGAGFTVRLHAGVRCGHYDRATDRIQPERWEEPHETDRPRMMVVERGPRFTLVTYDPTHATASERRERAAIDYLFSEEL
jgi:GT2 family glycosyltransferase